MNPHATSTIPISGRDQHVAVCNCGWRGLVRTGPDSQHLAEHDAQQHEQRMAEQR